jgi:sugar lactone lactonase YvrE
MSIDPSSVVVDLVAPTSCEIGENPLWHPVLETLFFTDIASGTIYAYKPDTGKCVVFGQTRITGGFTLHEDGSLLLFQDGPISILGMDGNVRQLISNGCPGNERFNDAIADPEGRVFAGAMGGNGRLLRFDLDGSVTEIMDGLNIPNGMGFTPDLRGMYFTDSTLRRIYYFDYDRMTGKLTNRRIFAEVDLKKGLPDGMTVDADGFVWTAVWFGGCLQRYAPDGGLDREVSLPVQQTSALTFGGPELRDIYVTSASSHGADPISPPGHDFGPARGGGLYRVQIPGMAGKSAFRSRLTFQL